MGAKGVKISLLYLRSCSFSAERIRLEDKSQQPHGPEPASLSRLKPAAKVTAALFLALVPAYSQITTLNLGTQGRNADFSNLPVTRPATVGTTLPATCQVGQLFFSSSAPAGANLYGCTAVNVWTLQGNNGTSSGSSGGSSGSASDSFNPTSVNFGSQTVSATSPAQAIVLANTGSVPVSISGITVSGANAGDFGESSNCGATVASGVSCTIAVSFTPSTTASESATVLISDNATGSPHSIALSGTGASASSGNGPAITPAAPTTTAGAPLTLTANKSVTWSLAPGSAGTISANGTSVVYTPPSSVPVQNARAGCMVAPNDSIFNTRIDNLPVNSNSATWMSSFIAPITFVPSWGLNIVDNTLPQTPMFFFYTNLQNGNYQIATWPNRKREGGAFTVDGNMDHHMVSLNHQSCQFYETYQEGVPNSSCSSCTAASGWKYSSSGYVQPSTASGGGTTDAAGLPLSPLTMHLSEVKAGSVNHALRFTLCTGCIYQGTHLWPATGSNGSTNASAPPMGARFRLKGSFVPSGVYAVNVSSGGSGYTSSPQVTFTGCQTAPAVTAMISGGSVTSVVINSMGANCVNPTVSFGGPGSGATATAQAFSSTSQVILTALQRYGMFLADNGTSGQIETDSNLNEDATVVSALNEIANAKLGASYFEVVDQSSLMVSATSSRVNPSNGYVTPVSYAALTATDGSGNTTTVPIALQPVVVGVPNSRLIVMAGMSGYQLPSWVNGSSNQSVTWTLTSGVGTVTSGGVYTPPASVSGPTATVVTATPAADPNSKTSVYLTIIPAGANPANSIRIDVASSSTYTDSQSNLWLADNLGFETGPFSVQNDSYPAGLWGSLTDQAIYQTFFYTYGDDITYGPFVVPNGNYKVGYLLARGGCSGTFSETQVYGNGLIWGPVQLEAQGQIGLHFDFGKAVNYACRTPYIAYIPAQVTNNLLYTTMRVVGGSNSHTSPEMNGLSIIPDTTAPHISIDTQQTTTVSAGAVVQMYSVGWYMSNAVTWSVTGGGSIDQTGLYTAPATAPGSNQTITITATSTANSSVQATATLTLTSGS